MKTKLLPVIGVVIFIYLLSGMQVGKIADMFLRMSVALFGIALLITAADILLKTFKWKLIFNVYNIPIPYSRFLTSWIVGLSLSLITPGKVGDFAKAYYLKDKAPLGKSLTTVIADRIVDLLTLFILAVIGLSVFAIRYSSSPTILITTFILFIGFVCAIFLFSKKSVASAILRPFYKKISHKGYAVKLKSLYSDFYAGLSLILERKKVLLLVIFITFFIWFSTVWVMYFVALSLGFTIPYTFLMVVFPIITLLEALPISFSGVGTRDAALIFFFSFIGIGKEASVSISILYLLTGYVFALIGFVFWYKNPIKLRET